MRMKQGDRLEGFSGQVINITGKLFDALVLGMLFLLCSIPIVTIGASATALYYAYDKVVRRSEGYTVRAFFHSFRMNFAQATLIWGLDGALMTVLILNVRYCFISGTSNWRLFLMMLFGLLFLIVCMAAITSFGALARFDMPTGWFIRFGYVVSLMHLGTSVITEACLISFAVIAYRYPVLILVLPAISVATVNMLLSPVLRKYECGADTPCSN